MIWSQHLVEVYKVFLLGGVWKIFWMQLEFSHGFGGYRRKHFYLIFGNLPIVIIVLFEIHLSILILEIVDVLQSGIFLCFIQVDFGDEAEWTGILSLGLKHASFQEEYFVFPRCVICTRIQIMI